MFENRLQNGTIECRNVDCPPVDCPHPVNRDGECCPVCLSEYNKIFENCALISKHTICLVYVNQSTE